MRPSGSSAHAIDYRCTRGRHDTITVELPDLGKLATTLNPIDVCEFDGGLAEITMTVNCAGGSPATVHVRAVDGKLPANASAAC